MFNKTRSQLVIYSVFISANCFAEIDQQPYATMQSISEESVSQIFKNSIALTRTQLDQQRGGFIDKSGFKISIGFEKIVVVNGKLEAKAQFYIPGLNLAKRDKNNVKDLALTMNALRERLNNKEYKGDHTKSEQEVVSETVDTVATTLESQIPKATGQRETTNLTTKQNKSDERYTDALLSMLQSTQSSSEASASSPASGSGAGSATVTSPAATSPTGPSPTVSTSLPTNLTSVVMNSTDSSLIQSFQMLNIKIDNLGQYRSRSVNSLMLPQIINSLR